MDRPCYQIYIYIYFNAILNSPTRRYILSRNFNRVSTGNFRVPSRGVNLPCGRYSRLRGSSNVRSAREGHWTHACLVGTPCPVRVCFTRAAVICNVVSEAARTSKKVKKKKFTLKLEPARDGPVGSPLFFLFRGFCATRSTRVTRRSESSVTLSPDRAPLLLFLLLLFFFLFELPRRFSLRAVAPLPREKSVCQLPADSSCKNNLRTAR